MKRFVSKVQNLGQKASEIRDALERVPGKVADIQQAVANAAGHIQKLRADLAASVGTLRAETDAQLVETLREIDSSTELFAEAGVRLRGVDMDLGPARKLIVQLERFEAVPLHHLRALLGANGHRPVQKALLAAILQAMLLVERVNLDHLDYSRLTVEIGLIPSVKIGWREENPSTRETHPAPDAVAPFAATRSEPLVSSAPIFAAKEAPSPVGAAPAAEVISVAPTAAERTPVESAPVKSAPSVLSRPDDAGPLLPPRWGPGALDRFKQMPDPKRYAGRPSGN